VSNINQYGHARRKQRGVGGRDGQPYLQGPFAPLQDEYTLTDLEVAGTIPDYLDGRYLRNGPNPIGEIDPEGIEGDDTLLKHDFVRGSTQSRSFGAGKALGEFVFHPSSPDTAEDDGVLMGFV
jgi:carotenoid cleavage dioxygenase-like enzyme